MAYVPGQQLQDPNDPNAPQPGAPASAAPTIGGTAAPAMGAVSGAAGSAVGSSPVAQSNGSQGGAGTGFVNIDRYLNANKGAAQDLATRAGQARQNDQSAFDKTLETTRGQMEAGTPQWQDPTKAVAAVTGATSDSMRDAAIKAAQGAINGSYSGPTALNYDVGNTADAKRAGALGNAATAGTQVASDTGTLSSYGTGLSAIDRAIYGSAQEQPTLQGTQKANEAQAQNEGQLKDSVAHNAQTRADMATKDAALVKKAFGDKATQIQADAQSKADAANAQQSADQQNGVIRDPNTGQVVQMPQGQRAAGWENGTGNATAANFLDAHGLNAIGQVLGDQGMATAQAGPQWVEGRNTTQTVPIAEDVNRHDIVGLEPVNNTKLAPKPDMSTALHDAVVARDKQAQQQTKQGQDLKLRNDLASRQHDAEEKRKERGG